MQIAINISEHDKNVLTRFVRGEGAEELAQGIIEGLIRAVYFGIPIPEHGRLVDADKLLREHHIDLSDVAPTVIPATKGEKHCKACKYSDNGMINVESERCKACYYDGRLGGNCLFVPKQTATKEGDA